MKNYSIVTTNNIESLIKAVNEMILQDYEPIGGMVLQQGIGSFAYYQTMYKRPIKDPIVINKEPLPDPIVINKEPLPDPTTNPYDLNVVAQKIDKRRKVK